MFCNASTNLDTRQCTIYQSGEYIWQSLAETVHRPKSTNQSIQTIACKSTLAIPKISRITYDVVNVC